MVVFPGILLSVLVASCFWQSVLTFIDFPCPILSAEYHKGCSLCKCSLVLGSLVPRENCRPAPELCEPVKATEVKTTITTTTTGKTTAAAHQLDIGDDTPLHCLIPGYEFARGCSLCKCEFVQGHFPFIQVCRHAPEICESTNGTTTTTTAAPDPTLLDVPKITYISSKPQVKPGSNVTLLCLANGNPPPVLAWEFISVSGKMSDAGVGQSLTIPEVDHSKVGVYVCRALNVHGLAARNVTVSLPEKLPIITKPPRNVFVSLGDSLTLTCEASGDPAPTILWSHHDTKGALQPADGMSGVTASAGGILFIENVSGDTSGIYVCNATNPAGTASATAIVSILPESS